MHRFRLFCGLLLSVIIGTVFLSTTATAQSKTITCKSQHLRYQYCRVNTENRVRLLRSLSNDPCIEGRTWGYDRRGVWVDDGCRGNFEVAFRTGGGGGWQGDYDQGRPSNRIPNWAIGQFEGYNQSANIEVSLRILDNGKVISRVGWLRFNGYFDGRNQEIVVGPNRFRIDRERRGIRTTQVGNRNNVVFYTRVR
jgi:hypothetical protein